MKLNSEMAGTPLKPYTTQVSWQQTTNFAAAIQDDNPVYFDDTRDGGIVAPPTFPVAVTWPILSRLGDFIESDKFPKEVLFTQVHYTEHLVINRLIKPGDELTITGEIVSIKPHRAGTHAIIGLTAVDRSNQPVFTEYIGAMLRGVECDNGHQTRDLPQIDPLASIDPAPTPAWTSLHTVDPLAPYIYDGCTGIEFPIHTSPSFAKQVGLPGIILQGTATLAYAVRELVNNEAGQDPGQIREIACSFTGMVMPGTDIEICCIGSRGDADFSHIFFEVINNKNKKAIRNGYVKIERKTQ